MSIYLEFGDGEQVQVASNRGWGDLRRLVDAKGVEGPLKTLVDSGELDSIAGLAESAQSLDADDDTVADTLAGLVEAVSSHGDQDDSLVVTDGMGPDDGEE